jgi:hypothetical protein
MKRSLGYELFGIKRILAERRKKELSGLGFFIYR